MNTVLDIDQDQGYRFEASTMIMPERFTAMEAGIFPLLFISHCQNQRDSKAVALDFSKMKFIDSSGVGALVKGLKHSRDNNIEMIIANPGAQLKAVLKMTRLESLFNYKNGKNQRRSDSSYANSELPETHPSINSKTKRVVDIVGSVVGLALTAIIFIPIAIAIKAESRGPLLFRQTRMGWMGSKFTIYKFRTMVADAEARKHEVRNEAEGAIFKNKNDPRITKVGKFLRRTSIDELPQFWNVLEGSMSLVGTRPPTPDEIEKYNIPHWQRLDVKPGITGEWQVSGRSSVKNFEDIIKMDLNYQRKWTLVYDFKLILKTVTVIFSKESGAA